MCSTAAVLASGGRAVLLRDPVSGANSWPSVVGLDGGMLLAGTAAEQHRRAAPRFAIEAPRRALDDEMPISLGERELAPVQVVSAFLGALRAEAVRLVTEPLDRLLLLAPTSYGLGDRRRDQLVAAGEAAGFREVELLDASAAAVLDAASAVGLADGALVIVCDLGEEWSASLVHLRAGAAVTLASESSRGGRDLDSRLVDDLNYQTQGWLDTRLALGGEAAARARADALDFARQLKHSLADNPGGVTGRITDDAPPYHLDQEWVGRLAEPGLRWVVASARSLLARAAAGIGGGSALGVKTPSRGQPTLTSPVRPGSTLADIAAVVLVGGNARLAAAEQILGAGLERPVVRLDEPELAAARGAVRYLPTIGERRVAADHPKWRVEPLSWPVPGGRGRLVRWLVRDGESFQRGAVLAQVRTNDERVFDLTAADDGTLLNPRARAGEIVGPTVLAFSRRPASLFAGDPPGKRVELAGPGEWLLTPDRQVLVECAATARAVRLWAIPDGGLLRDFQPEADGDAPTRGRVFVQPDGRLALVTWNQAGSFAVWDVQSGRRTAAFKDPNGPGNVLVNEAQWRLTAEGEDSGSAGRYRRSVLTVWDLATGKRLDKIENRRLPGYGERSAHDGFGAEAVSPDGRLHAVGQRTPVGVTALALRETTSEAIMFRAEHPTSNRVRLAFTTDGQFLLANWEADARSQVDVWEL